MKGRKHKAAGGQAEHGDREYEKDLATKNMRYTYQSHVEDEAEEKKRGGRAKRKHGGMVHHEAGKHMGQAKHVGKVEGHMPKAHAGRKPRKSGGRAGSDRNPFSSAKSGSDAMGHRTVEMD